jgi:hypothetical protein
LNSTNFADLSKSADGLSVSPGPLLFGVIKQSRIERPFDALPVFGAMRCSAGIPVDFETVAVRVGTIQRPADPVIDSMHRDPLPAQPTVNPPEFLQAEMTSIEVYRYGDMSKIDVQWQALTNYSVPLITR